VNRITKKFHNLKQQNKCAFVAYICGGDPDYLTSLDIMKSLPNLGVDIIEIGVPFLDPAGDGPIIEASAKRAIKAGMNLKKTLQMIKEFRKNDNITPIVIMSYFNPILKFGIDKFFFEAKKSGIDGVLIVDLPLEEENEIINEISKNKLDFIRLIAPTTSIDRAKKILKNSSGFVYLISILGITGTKMAEPKDNIVNLKKLKKISSLPIVVGFGIQNENQAQQFSQIGFDGVVVGSAIVKEISEQKSSKQNIANLQDKIVKFSSAIKNKI